MHFNASFRPINLIVTPLAGLLCLCVHAQAMAAEKQPPSEPEVHMQSWSVQYGFSSECSGDSCKVTIDYGGDADPDVTINGKKISLPQQTEKTDGKKRTFTTTIPRDTQSIEISMPERVRFLPPPIPMCPPGWYKHEVNLTTGEYECRLMKPRIICPAGQSAYQTDTTFGCRSDKTDPAPSAP